MTNSKDGLLSFASHAQDPFQRSEAEGEKRDEHCVLALCMLRGNFVWVVAAVAHHMWDVLSSHMYSASILYRICCQAIGTTWVWQPHVPKAFTSYAPYKSFVHLLMKKMFA